MQSLFVTTTTQGTVDSELTVVQLQSDNLFNSKMQRAGVICNLVPSNKGRNKLIVDGYLFCKDKNRGDTFYWCCDKRKSFICSGYATTTLVNGEHQLKTTREHNHAPVATQQDVTRARSLIKKRAAESRDTPAQIIQREANNVPGPSRSALPSDHAIKQAIQRTRSRHAPSEPNTLAELDIPTNLRIVEGEHFFIKDRDVGTEKILIFSTVSNLVHLQKSEIWIMDGTFKTVPRLFHQLYSIHGFVGTGENKSIMPLVFALMTSKSQECYSALFQEIIDFAANNDIELNPVRVLTDFEQAPINAITYEFPGAIAKGCFFHLGHSLWRRIQSAGLVRRYGEDPDFSLKMRLILALAFLPPSEIPDAFNDVKAGIPHEAESVCSWFDENYVNGRCRRGRGRPLYPPTFWSVADQLDAGLPRTQNSVEAWHRRLGSLLSRKHVDVFTMINQLRHEQQRTKKRFEDILQGKPIPKTKNYLEREARISSVYDNREHRTRMEFLRGMAYNLQF